MTILSSVTQLLLQCTLLESDTGISVWLNKGHILTRFEIRVLTMHIFRKFKIKMNEKVYVFPTFKTVNPSHKNTRQLTSNRSTKIDCIRVTSQVTFVTC